MDAPPRAISRQHSVCFSPDSWLSHGCLLTGVGLGVSGPIRYWNATPYMQTWSLDIQHELPGNVLVDVGYVAPRGTHLYFGGPGSINYPGSWVESLSSSQI